MYNRLLVWTTAYAPLVFVFFCNRPQLSWQWTSGILVAFGIIETIAVATVDSLPPLTTIAPRDHMTALFTGAPLPGLSGWYFALSLIPLGLAIAAAVGAAAATRRWDERWWRWCCWPAPSYTTSSGQPGDPHTTLR